MAVYFLDTSALARRYLHQETGSLWLRGWIAPDAQNEIILSALTLVEMASLLARRQYEGTLSEEAFTRISETFRVHAEKQYTLITLNEAVLDLASNLFAKYPLLRALDAIQLACALQEAQARGAFPIFVCADKRLLAAAAAEDFPIDDPQDHA